jgi:molybdenum cofactor guanylyltransferase
MTAMGLGNKAGPANRAGITGLILAGGLGTRMGGADKGLQLLHGRPLIAWVLERLAPQVGEVLINANRNLARYSQFGPRVVPDILAGQAGPLAGLHRGLMEASGSLVAMVPCDAPDFPQDLVSRLATALNERQVDVAFARSGGQSQPVFCLARKSLLPQLTAFVEEGGRKVDAWFATVRAAAVDFGREADFLNVNSTEELRQLEAGQTTTSRE